MPKVLAQTGTSLADVYNVKGSIAGVEELISREVHLTHEMGATIFSERVGGAVVSFSTGAIAQNLASEGVTVVDLVPTRLLGLQVFTDVASRLTRAQVSLTPDPPAETEIPIWYWETGDPEKALDVMVAGSVANLIVLEPVMTPLLPNMLFGASQPRTVPNITLRVLTAGFGAGTVTTRCIVYFGFAISRAVNSHGLPVPSW